MANHTTRARQMLGALLAALVLSGCLFDEQPPCRIGGAECPAGQVCRLNYDDGGVNIPAEDGTYGQCVFLPDAASGELPGGGEEFDEPDMDVDPAENFEQEFVCPEDTELVDGGCREVTTAFALDLTQNPFLNGDDWAFQQERVEDFAPGEFCGYKSDDPILDEGRSPSPKRDAVRGVRFDQSEGDTPGDSVTCIAPGALPQSNVVLSVHAEPLWNPSNGQQETFVAIGGHNSDGIARPSSFSIGRMGLNPNQPDDEAAVFAFCRGQFERAIQPIANPDSPDAPPNEARDHWTLLLSLDENGGAGHRWTLDCGLVYGEDHGEPVVRFVLRAMHDSLPAPVQVELTFPEAPILPMLAADPLGLRVVQVGGIDEVDPQAWPTPTLNTWVSRVDIQGYGPVVPERPVEPGQNNAPDERQPVPPASE